MADLPQAIRAKLVTAFPTYHIGEDVPQSATDPYVWFQRQGDVLDDCLKYPPLIDSVLFDFEIVSSDIATCRILTNSVKEYLSTILLHSVSFAVDSGTQTVHAFDIEDHDDSYIPHTVEQDAKLHIGSFRATAHLGNITLI